MLGGLGSTIKCKMVKRAVGEEKADFVCLQETKLRKMEAKNIKLMRANDDVDWVYKEAIGASGELVSFWDSKKFVKEGEITSNN